MPTKRLKSQLESLQQTLNQADGPLSEEEREALQTLADNIEAKLTLMEAEEAMTEADPTLVDGVNLLIERLEARHPTLVGTLRSVAQSLSDMGI
ncbi:DUF4404 family protein [Pseudomonas jilinensis]|uniref:DUF4404 domain-containing protein n=1 Tax=Pseudomonas jilinensis TaxID=2078689 RepID=A0A396S274_9PSED|nr:DUF4404 family protein [Pseudomonas jilinensis]RHW20121.1 DUF4404 domain-containing protein [Pseudomonas jilinensis]